MLVVSRKRGFTLVEIVFICGLIVVVSGLALMSLKSGQNKAPARGLAIAVAEEFRGARQLAIAEGHPVALGIPTNGGANPTSTSVYRLQGWDKPTVTWVRNYEGDYPDQSFFPATWAGPSFTLNAPATSISKFDLFNVAANLDEWVPDEFENDYLFVFTPDGGLFTNGLPALNGEYSVVVGTDLGIGPSTLTSTGPPLRSVTSGLSMVTLLVSPAGGVRDVTDLPGGNVPIGGGTLSPPSPPQGRTEGDPASQIKLSPILVKPAPEFAPPNEGFCVPGQYVTLEVYARDPAGRELFSRWKQGTDKGSFTYPDGDVGDDDVPELDRMEYVPDYDWGAGELGAYRARWAWTVPLNTAPGDSYAIQVDVSDATGTAEIETPQTITMRAAPEGRLLIEKRVNGQWKLFSMNPDGSAAVQITPDGVQELMPQVDNSGERIAFIEEGPGGLDARRVRIRNRAANTNTIIDPGPARYTSVSLSPSGQWISYHRWINPAQGELITQQTDGKSRFRIIQNWQGSGHDIKKTRTGFDGPETRWMFYEQGRNIEKLDLNAVVETPAGTDTVAPASVTFFSTVTNSVGTQESLYCPTPFINPDTGADMLLISVGNNNSRMILSTRAGQPNVDFNGDGFGGGSMFDYNEPVTGGSNNIDDDYPSITNNGNELSFTRSPQSSSDTSTPTSDDDDQTVVVMRWANGTGNFGGAGNTYTITGDVRRSVWLPALEDI